jgi:hypothetical protein
MEAEAEAATASFEALFKGDGKVGDVPKGGGGGGGGAMVVTDDDEAEEKEEEETPRCP